jgi:ABC-type multidrug transport system ATPase subunit
MRPQVAIRAQGLMKTLGTRTVLRGIQVAIIAGECVVLRGENGAGKTTLLRCLAGLVRPDAGDVRWFDRSPRETSAHRLIGMVAHESQLYPHLTLRENLILAGRLQDLGVPQLMASRWIEAASVSEDADRLPKEVSQGMRRRTSLARALLHDPPILLLDEPFSGLDRAGREWLCEVLQTRQRQGQTTCLVTHEEPTPRLLADRVLELRAGRLETAAGAMSAQSPVAGFRRKTVLENASRG